MGISKGLGPLNMYLGTEEGVSFQTDNELFLCSNCNGKQYLIYARDMKDLGSKFRISVLPNGKVLLQDFRDMYVSWMNCEGTIYLETEKSTPDELCEFDVFNDGEKVLFKASNGLYVCRTYRHHGDNIEASRSAMDDCCRLRPGLGDMYAPCFDISDIELNDVSKLICRPCVLKKETFVNKTDVAQSHGFTLSWETRTTDTTHWETTWGLNTTFSASFSVLGFQANITYNGTFQKVATASRSIVEKRSITVDVPQHSKVTAQLVVSKMENASIPFTAFIRKTKVNGETVALEEKGVWKGLVYDTVTLETKQDPNGDFEYTCRAL
ncbi:uncharacterized protein LOC130291159 [Hyla sarda]|uniref:uncharacterized protein LOC130291159 n=1 Tax=Hyla sarda TaxID=327740 RepID=UPI0024C2D130|nr:uncharacterized protein LOC130291159 [Hyla sarda]